MQLTLAFHIDQMEIGLYLLYPPLSCRLTITKSENSVICLVKHIFILLNK